METEIRSFFEGAGKEATDQLESDANILMRIDGTPYTLTLTGEREVKVAKDAEAENDIEISGKKRIMDDLFSSSTMKEYCDKMISYIKNRKCPEVKILLPRTNKGTAKFQRVYVYFLRRMVLLK